MYLAVANQYLKLKRIIIMYNDSMKGTEYQWNKYKFIRESQNQRDKFQDYSSQSQLQSQLSKSTYQMKDVLNQHQFVQFANYLKMQPLRTQNLCQSFYHLNNQQKQKTQSNEHSNHKFQTQFEKWKACQKQQKVEQKNIIQKIRFKYYSKIQQKNDKSCNQNQTTNERLTQIKDQYRMRLQKILNDEEKQLKFDNLKQENEETIFMQQKATNYKQTAIQTQLDVQKQLENINKRKRNEQIERIAYKRQRQLLQSTCFSKIIKNPPKPMQCEPPIMSKIAKSQKTCAPINEDKLISEQQKQLQPVQKIKKYRINMQKLLQMPHRKFLTFYTINKHQLQAYAKEEELRKLKQLRDEALKRQQCVEELRRRVAAQGSVLVNKLTREQREKLFRVLYSDEMQMQ